MSDKPDDRPKECADDPSSQAPELYILIRGEQFPRPGLETFFAEINEDRDGCTCQPVAGAYCSCNKVSACSCVPVCTCESVCSCVGHDRCSCVGHTTCSCNAHSYSTTGCRCAPVH